MLKFHIKGAGNIVSLKLKKKSESAFNKNECGNSSTLSRTKNINNYIYKNSLKSIKLLIKKSSIKLL